jgi:hypothetical protein
MKPRNRLASLYEEWRLMSEAEGEAIRTAAWQHVRHCQNTKADLQYKIVAATEELNAAFCSAEEIRQQFRPVLEHLINLEIRNNQLLGDGRTRLENERDQLDKSQRSLRQVRGAYGTSLTGAAF